MLNSLLWSSCLYIKISEWPQWWQRSHSTKVISPGQLSGRMKIFIPILALANRPGYHKRLTRLNLENTTYSGRWS